MQRVLDVLNEANLDKESKDLEKFYASVKLRSQGITDPQAKQKLIVELYDKFFRRAFPRTTEKLGIVYTPVEIVDFIIHSVNEVLQSEFGQTLGSPGVHIIDPFTGTGTFITRLLQSGLIAPEEMEHKFRHEIHANEIVLLAYYIAAINIEAVYHGLQGGEYVPFEGICLTDTFQMYESDDLISHYMPDNSERRKRQKATDIRVIVGNPPYSKGQESANDNNANVEYPTLDGRIRDTYVARSTATLKNSLYDSYIRAIRWASDRFGDAGVMAYVTNAGWVDGNAADGLRACLADEFSELYIFHLRGNQRTSGELSRREGGKIFGSGSRAPIAISVLVKNPDSTQRGRIHFHDIGDYLDQKQKLAIIRDFGSIGGISKIDGWSSIEPDEHHDWLKQRDASFDAFIKIGERGNKTDALLFGEYSGGAKTNRDAWCFNPSLESLTSNVKGMLDVYNSERRRFHLGRTENVNLEDFVISDPTRISWNRSLLRHLAGDREHRFDPAALRRSHYRPFTPQWLYFDRSMISDIGKMPRFFPKADTENRMIVLKLRWSGYGQIASMSDRVIELQSDGGTQCFPLYVFDEENAEPEDLFSEESGPLNSRDGITDAGLKHFQDAYPGETITKEDLFYYVYGLLHSEDYRAKYADNLSKELPRIPRVKTAADFWAFSRAGRELGDLHVNYETVETYPVTIKQGDLRLADIKNSEAFYRVTKWAFGKAGKEKDKTTVIYNANITMQDVPMEAYDYVVNGKPALEWVMERQVVKTDKDSGIENDANRYAIETMNNPAYPLELFQRVITVSLRTMEIVRGLPKLEVME
ncbi:MAG: DEAD/DEAH box helicase [Roseovarius sp.]|nr:DEAD/DEAH box helicase [Roseovarius sp.]